MFKETYDYSNNSIKKHKICNLLIKYFYIVILILLVLAQIYVLINIFLPSRSTITLEYVCAIEAPLLLLFMMVSLVITKFVDIKKYQETYARHMRYQNLRKIEMIRFILNIGDYDNDKDEQLKLFMDRILKIEQDNIEKFCINMEQNETNLREGLDGLSNSLS